MDIDPTCPVVKNMLLLDSEGKRVAVKYYSPEWYALMCCIYVYILCRILQLIIMWACLGGDQRDASCFTHRSTVNAQANFEKSVYAKTCRTNARSEGRWVGGKENSDLHLRRGECTTMYHAHHPA